MILTIRAHKRYAVRQSVRLRSSLADWQSSGLMIELSTEGCRVSGLGETELSPGDAVVVEREHMQWRGRICWTHSGIAGVRLDRRLTGKELTAQLTSLRGGEGSLAVEAGFSDAASLLRA